MSYRLKRGRSRLSQLNDICCHISNSRCQSRLSLSGMRWKHPIITTFPLASAQVVLHWRGAVLVGEENSAKKSPRKETLIPGGSVESVSFSRANLNFSARNKLGASKQHTYHTRQKIICNIFFTQHPNHQQVNQTVQRNFKRTERREHHSQRSGRSVCPATRQFLRRAGHNLKRIQQRAANNTINLSHPDKFASCLFHLRTIHSQVTSSPRLFSIMQ